MKTKISKAWYKKLVDLCYIQSYSNNEKRMILYLDKVLNELDLKYDIDKIGNIIVTKGIAKTYPCVVSHMDTVHNIVDNYMVYNDKGKLFAISNKVHTGIGGDDKCGVFACIYFLTILPAVKIVFFTQEESGCKGSNRIDKSFFDDCRYIIQLDRRGSRDFIDTKYGQKTVSQNFLSEVGKIRKKYKFKSAEGSITDVVNLWSDGIGLSCLNLSCGYYNPHCNSEYIEVDELWHSILFTKEMIKTLKPKQYKSTKKQTKSKVYNAYNYKLRVWCSGCKKNKPKKWGVYKNSVFVCWECNRDNAEDICQSCYKSCDKNDLRYSTSIGKFACFKCRAIKNNDKMICDICNKPSYKNHGHENVNGENFVCFACYLESQTNKNLNELETCYICNRDMDKNKGEYDGETFTCSDCENLEEIKDEETTNITDIIIATEVCDNCLEDVSITKGLYGYKNTVFKCFDCIKPNNKHKIN